MWVFAGAFPVRCGVCVWIGTPLEEENDLFLRLKCLQADQDLFLLEDDWGVAGAEPVFQESVSRHMRTKIANGS